jgi:uncharacterized protein
VTPTDLFDLASLRLTSGEGTRLNLQVRLSPLTFAGADYAPVPAVVDAVLDISCTTGGGFSLRLRFAAELHGPCMRCLRPASPPIVVDAREVEVPGGGDELDSPYVVAGQLDLTQWAHDAFALAAPDQVLCEAGCVGLCPVCALPLAELEPDHEHERPPDPRWEKLRELRLE